MNEDIGNRLEMLAFEVRTGMKVLGEKMDGHQADQAALSLRLDSLQARVIMMELEAERQKTKLVIGILVAVVTGGGTSALARIFGGG